MADWDQLREMRDDVVPPDFEGLARTARRRAHRARAAAGVLAGLVLVGGGLGVASIDRHTGDRVRPAKDPTGQVTDPPETARDLPAADAGADYATLARARYRIPLGDGLAFDVDVPDDSYAHEDGLFVASGPVVLKVEIAGDDFGIPRDACHRQVIHPIGPTVADLVRAIRASVPFRVAPPRSVVLGGARGTYLEAALPATYDARECEGGKVQLPGTHGNAVDSVAPYLGRWWVLDVEGRRVMVQQGCWQCTTDDLDAAGSIPASITFTTLE